MAEKYVPSTENRRLWCQGTVGRPHEFEFWKYAPQAEGYPDSRACFIFQCVACGRKRYCADAEGTVEQEERDQPDQEQTPDLRPVNLVLHVYVDAVAEDGERRRLCDHREARPTAGLSESGLEALLSGLCEAAWEAFDTARRFDE